MLLIIILTITFLSTNKNNQIVNAFLGYSIYLPLVVKSETQPTPAPTPVPTQSNCDPSYPTVCIPPPPPDLDCGDISYRNFTVLQPDPHNFDSDLDGIGCEL